MNAMNGVLAGIALCGLTLACGCASGPVAFKRSSVPIPPQGYTVCGADVAETSTQVWVFGFGGTYTGSQQHIAYKRALAKAGGADGLIGMCIDQNMVGVNPIFVKVTTTITGTPIKFNPAAKK